MVNIKTLVMKSTLHIRTKFDQPGLLKNIVEKLACRRSDNGINRLKMPRSMEAIQSSSIDAFVSGNVEFDYNEKEKIRMPFISSFHFTCIKTKNSPYRLAWSSSLS